MALKKKATRKKSSAQFMRVDLNPRDLAILSTVAQKTRLPKKVILFALKEAKLTGGVSLIAKELVPGRSSKSSPLTKRVARELEVWGQSYEDARSATRRQIREPVRNRRAERSRG